MDQKTASIIAPVRWDTLDTLLDFIRTQADLRRCPILQSMSLESAVEAFFQELMYSGQGKSQTISCFFQGDTLSITPMKQGEETAELTLDRFPQLELCYRHPTYRFRLL